MVLGRHLGLMPLSGSPLREVNLEGRLLGDVERRPQLEAAAEAEGGAFAAGRQCFSVFYLSSSHLVVALGAGQAEAECPTSALLSAPLGLQIEALPVHRGRKGLEQHCLLPGTQLRPCSLLCVPEGG